MPEDRLNPFLNNRERLIFQQYWSTVGTSNAASMGPPYQPDPEPAESPDSDRCVQCGMHEDECECCPDCGEYECRCEEDYYEEDEDPYRPGTIPTEPHMTSLPGLETPDGQDMHGFRLAELSDGYRISDEWPDDPIRRAQTVAPDGIIDNYTLYLLGNLRDRLCAMGALRGCNHCGLVVRGSMIKPPHFRCKECTKNIKKCQYCGALLNSRQRNGRRNNECNNCLKQYVQQYNYTANFRPRMLDSDLAIPAEQRLMIGVEFEIEAEAQLPLAKEIDDRYTWCYLKHDGSLQNGFEIVTQPMTEKWINRREEEFQDFFSRVFDSAYLDWHCGTHFHISKAPFSSVELYKMLKFIYDNENIMFQISRRLDREWMERYAGFRTENGKDLIKKAARRKNVKNNPQAPGGSGDKYVAVNFSKHNTVEFRFFGGCDSYDTFMEWLQFVLAVAKFAKAEPVQNMTWNRFTEWSRSLRYPYLQSLISGVAP